MPRLTVLSRHFFLEAESAAPLIAADILYWDDDDGAPLGKEKPHLHLNPEMPAFDALEAAILEEGLAPFWWFSAGWHTAQKGNR